MPTEMGLLYFGCGVMAVCTATVLFAMGVLVGRIDAFERDQQSVNAYVARDDEPRPLDAAEPSPAEELRAAETSEAAPAPVEPEAQVGAEAPAEAPEAKDGTAPEEGSAAETEEAVNENRAGHFPSLHEVEAAIARPEAPPSIVGRYSAGGAHYRIYSDGSIEAETEDGEFKFASMGEFKAFIAARRP